MCDKIFLFEWVEEWEMMNKKQWCVIFFWWNNFKNKKTSIFVGSIWAVIIESAQNPLLYSEVGQMSYHKTGTPPFDMVKTPKKGLLYLEISASELDPC